MTQFLRWVAIGFLLGAVLLLTAAWLAFGVVAAPEYLEF